MKILGREIHIGLVSTVILTIIYGCIIIYSASNAMTSNPDHFNLAYKQLIFACALSFICIFIFFIKLKLIAEMTWFMYIVSILMLISVFFIGRTSHGAQRWISLGPLVIQPSEFAKISIILALARFMSNNMDKNKKISFIVGSTLIIAFPLVLILKQPDLGTSLTLIPILVSMLFMAGIKKRYFMILFPFAVIPLLIILLAKKGYIKIEEIRNLLFFLKPYQQNRLLAFIDPNIDPRGMSYNLIQSQIAIGSGGMFGKGFMGGTQTHLRFLPERHTDFVFSVLGEEWGFTGGTVLLTLYTFMLRFGLNIADKCEDFFPKLASTGIIIMLLFHIGTNIGMTIGLMPITGLPLPFVSYGGSSLLTLLISIGLLLNFYANKDQVLYR